MRMRKTAIRTALACGAVSVLGAAAMAGAAPAIASTGTSTALAGATPVTVPPAARQALAASDGWGSAGTGTTGGSAADDAHVFVVHTRDELVAAVAGDVPKIVLIAGTIDANAGRTCADYADPAYSLDAFLATYDPAVWGRTTLPSGPLEDARVRSAKSQTTQIKLNVGSNTTIFGVRNARLLGGNLALTNVSNVVIRNVTF